MLAKGRLYIVDLTSNPETAMVIDTPAPRIKTRKILLITDIQDCDEDIQYVKRYISLISLHGLSCVMKYVGPLLTNKYEHLLFANDK